MLDGRLAELLTTWRDAGLSTDEIAFKLRDRDVKVSGSTVARWLKDIEMAA